MFGLRPGGAVLVLDGAAALAALLPVAYVAGGFVLGYLLSRLSRALQRRRARAEALERARPAERPRRWLTEQERKQAHDLLRLLK